MVDGAVAVVGGMVNGSGGGLAGLGADMGKLAYAILALPFLSFLINGLWLGRKNASASGWTATLLLGATLLCAVALACGYHAQVLSHPELYPNRAAMAWEHIWMAFDTGSGSMPAAKIGFYLDPISIMMVLVISFISFLVHLYSIGYMRGDKGAGRFFPLLSFFTFTMLGLVVSSNLVQTFIFWELVGTASYLLIGFWYHKPSAVAASKKAFILTRFADAFFLMGLITVGVVVGSFDFATLNGPAAAIALDHSVRIGFLGANVLTMGTLCIYMGAWGKSAMFPFHVWLPDAMEGPTPVSSLIHSATMVVAGIYLTARLFPLFSAAEYTLRVVEFTGAFTAVFAAVIACTQVDLKRILAFSTLSQLGMMMFSLGTGSAESFTGSMFHVFSHAFFKCLLFLSAGVVIHAIHSNDIRDAGGLRKVLPRTYWSTLIACLAIAGIFPFSGFFSKEEILHTAFANGHYGAFLAGLLTSGLTAFYMSRYFFLVFHGKASKSHAESESGNGHAGAQAHGHDKAHASPAREGLLMTLPILILALPSALIGWLSKGFFLRTVLPWTAHPADLAGAAEASGHVGAAWLPLVASLLAITGVGLSWYLYVMKRHGAGYPEGAQPGWYRLLYHKFYIDELYLFLVKKVGARLIATPITWVERSLVNGSFDWVTYALRRLASVQGLIQSGQVQFYIATALLGLLAVVWFGGIRL